MSEDHEPKSDDEFSQFAQSIRLTELCAVASSCRDGMMCCLGYHIIGGFNVVYELNFSDGVTWLARIPLPYNCYQPEEISISYAATLKYIKKHCTTLPVPEVYAYDVQSSPTNKVNATYIIMERLPGRELPLIELTSFDPDPEDIARAKKVHAQLTDVILQLASLKFDKIGSLREASDGTFFVGPFTDMNATAYPQHKAVAYKKLDARYKGPFKSTSDWYKSMAELDRTYGIEDPEEEEEDRAETVATYELHAEFSEHFVLPEFNEGPFVINHNDLTIQNVLVDEDLNVTGIIDFPGTIVPLPSLCVYPWLFSDNISGLVTDRDMYLDVFINQECQFPSSALQSRELRKDLMKKAQSRRDFELGLMGPYTSLVLPRLYQEINGRALDYNAEYQRIVDTHDWFKELVPAGEDGLYSWQRADD